MWNSQKRGFLLFVTLVSHLACHIDARCPQASDRTAGQESGRQLLGDGAPAGAISSAPANASNGPGAVQTRDRLLFMILYAMPPQLQNKRLAWLRRCITRLSENVLPWTPIHVVVWFHVLPSLNETDFMYTALKGNIEFLQLGREEWIDLDPDWIRPELGHNPQLRWTTGMGDVFNTEYRRTGHWQCIYGFNWALRRGYEYAIKWDDDSFVEGPVKYNILDLLRSKQIEFAWRLWIWDGWGYLSGLAELARFYIAISGITPTHLYEACNPPNIDGVFWNEVQQHDCCGKQAGWKGQVYFGNSLLYKTSVFGRQDVQEYLRLAMGSGGLYRARWTEQAVFHMIPLMFIPKDKVLELDWPYTHIGR